MGFDPGLRLMEPDADGIDPAFRRDVVQGLSQPHKAIPARWFYDARGSQLFEAITVQPEYYPTRAETEILAGQGADFAELVGPGRVVVEFGSGSSAKTPHLLSAIAPSAYVPIDISGDFLRQSAQALSRQFPALEVIPVEADFTHPVTLPDAVRGRPMLGFFPGSTIGNLVPASAVDLLRSMRDTLGTGAQLLIGMDRIKDDHTLLAAYDDAAGVTAAFNMNLLERINRELDGDIPLSAFRHKVAWIDALARIEMHLEAQRDLAFHVAGRTFTMRAGETIHTENSHKYDARSAALLLLAGGWTPLDEWTDAAGRFSLVLAQAAAVRMAP
ncbi:L-histidine N(alpha)-methyltransferase [Novosphingobium sp. KCTC 2891]|uniref:L-histidine N(alpha)-methyltransferase n=1 Tax=Novosphingobium sp. KCTC 2891 TaxID=2989730 RepID=UPI00222392F2|nr:L-histidine N(alpha)-methyltransferase [Novosphingobium sp. KCTC 2891]MCW1382665.1 L-histidine N(alpha)-methyltransferase [Novosphingobium sp. KCTC 2891]